MSLAVANFKSEPFTNNKELNLTTVPWSSQELNHQHPFELRR